MAAREKSWLPGRSRLRHAVCKRLPPASCWAIPGAREAGGQRVAAGRGAGEAGAAAGEGEAAGSSGRGDRLEGPGSKIKP